MAANKDPIWSSAPDVQWIVIPSGTAANTALDGTGTVFTAFTADATNGGYVQSIRVKAPSVSAATVMRVFINNGSTNATAANNSLIEELSIPIVTSSNTAASPTWDIPINRALMPGYKINICLGTSVTGAVMATAFAGKF